VSRPDSQAGEIQWPLYWVFGTELPRVVVNEALALVAQTADEDESYQDVVRVFAELHNPLPRSVPANVYQPDSWPIPLRMTTGALVYSPYRVAVAVKSRPFAGATATILPGVDNDNVLGNPEPGTVRTATTDADLASSAGVPPHGADTETLS